MKTCTLPFSEGYAQAAVLPAVVSGAELALRKGEALRVSRDGCPSAIMCVEGLVWLTESGNAKDVVLQAGECWLLKRPAVAVLEAIEGDAVVKIG
jgi:hypothetical protein